MDENQVPDEAPVNTPPGDEPHAKTTGEAISDKAKEAARQFADETEQTLEEFKHLSLLSFFSFDRMFFPVIARYVFLFIVAIIAIGALFGVLGGLASFVSVGLLAGIGTIIGSVLFAVLALIGVRFWFEFLLVAFKINEAVQEIRKKY